MAGILLEHLLAPQRSLDRFGGTPKHITGSAMRICSDRAAEGGLSYGGEEGISWQHTTRTAIFRWAASSATSKRPPALTWWRLEVMPVDSAPILKQETLVVTEHPYALGWVHRAQFKPGHNSMAARKREPGDKEFASIEAALRWMESGPHDPWESTSRLVAGVSLPENPLPPAKLRNERERAMWVFGVCEDFDACEKLLQQSERVNRLLTLTEKNRIRPWHPNANRRDGEELRLHDDVIAERESLMRLAIHQALAGPHDESDFWTGRAVVDKVDDIYCGHLNNRNKQVARSVRGERGLDDVV